MSSMNTIFSGPRQANGSHHITPVPEIPDDLRRRVERLENLLEHTGFQERISQLERRVGDVVGLAAVPETSRGREATKAEVIVPPTPSELVSWADYLRRTRLCTTLDDSIRPAVEATVENRGKCKPAAAVGLVIRCCNSPASPLFERSGKSAGSRIFVARWIWDAFVAFLRATPDAVTALASSRRSLSSGYRGMSVADVFLVWFRENRGRFDPNATTAS